MEVYLIRLNKTGLFQSCGYIYTIVWMHHMNPNKTHGEKRLMETIQEY